MIIPSGPGEPSLVPYAEPTWLTPGYYSPYFKEVRTARFVTRGVGLNRLLLFQTHRKYNKAMRQFMDEVIAPDAALNGPRGKRPSPEVYKKMAYVHPRFPRVSR